MKLSSISKHAVGLYTLLGPYSALCAPTPQGSGSSSTLVPVGSPYPSPTVPIGGPGNFVSIDKSTKLFNINGKVQYFAGTNSWWLAYLSSNDDITTVLQNIASSGLLVTRLWGSLNTNDHTQNSTVWFQELKDGQQTFNFDPNFGIPKLDFVISQAEALNVKLVIPLLNYWDTLGGIGSYVRGYGGSYTSFFTDANSQAAYLNWVDLVVDRYKSSPAIFSWEICNEPRCEGCDTSVITKWAANVSAQIKKKDSNHLVSLGDEGWFNMTAPSTVTNTYPYQGTNGVDFVANLAVSTIDYGTFHMYPSGSQNSWGEPDNWGPTWIQEHDTAGQHAGKPVVLEEYGTTDSPMVSIMSSWQTAVIKSGIAGDHFWQFNESIPDVGENADDGLGILYDTTSGSPFDVLAIQHAKAMTHKSVGS